jgi:membrane protein
VSSDFVARNVESLIRLRGPVGFVSLILLMWSASKMVGALNRGINNALGFEWSRDAYLSPFRNFGLTLTVSLILLLTIALAPLAEILSGLEQGFIGRRGNMAIDRITVQLTGFVISFVLLSAVYRLVPYQRLPWRDLLPGILVAAGVLEIAKRLFALYVGSMSRFDAIYGSVSSVIVLLIWLYFFARVVLYGTEVIGAYREVRNARDAELAE